MMQYTFEYQELAKGVIVVYAENEEDAKEKALNLDGDVHINKSFEEIGSLVMTKDVD